MSPSERREMIRKDNTDLSLTQQCKLLKISRSSIYYTPVGFDQVTIDLTHEIDRIFTKYPFFSSRQIAAYLPQSGFSAGRHRVRRLMGIMGLQAIYKGPNTSKKHPQHKDLAIPAEKAVDHTARSCLVQRYYLHSSEERVSLSGGNNGFGNTQSEVLAVVKYDGCQLLY